MKLELIQNNPSEIKNNKPFLFIHGMYHGAWCFGDNFLPLLEKEGYKAYALSLSNHGKSDRRKSFNLLTIAQYVKDVEEAVEIIGTEPILAGHSIQINIILFHILSPFLLSRKNLKFLQKWEGLD